MSTILALQARMRPKEGPGGPIYWRLRGRLNALLHASDILRAAAPSDTQGDSIHASARALETDIEALRKTSSEPPESEVKHLEARIDRVQKLLLELDATVPTSDFRARVDVDLFPVPVVTGYVTLLASHFAGDPERRDRIDLILTHLCSKPENEGIRQLRPRHEVGELLGQVSQGHRAQADRREAAVRFFEKARTTIEQISDPELIFKNGVYSDIYGLKLALGLDFLDPAVLHAVAALNVTIKNLLARKRMAQEAVVSAEGEVREALESSHDSPELSDNARFEKLRAEGRLVMDDLGSHRAWQGIRRRQITRVIGLLVFGLGLGSLYLDRPPRPPEVALSPAQLSALSPHLGHGNTVGSSKAQMLYATIDPFEWNRLDPEEKQREAEDLARELTRQTPLQDAAVRCEERLAILIQRGKVVFLQ